MRCPRGAPKHHNPRSSGKDRSSDSNKGHSWERLLSNNGEHIGRKCRNCGKVMYNPRGLMMNGELVC